jgi:hypothetical protein
VVAYDGIEGAGKAIAGLPPQFHVREAQAESAPDGRNELRLLEIVVGDGIAPGVQTLKPSLIRFAYGGPRKLDSSGPNADPLHRDEGRG